MKVRINPFINYFGEVIDYSQENDTGTDIGRVYDMNFNIQTKPFTLDIPSPPRSIRKRDGTTTTLTEAQIKKYITGKIKSALRRRVIKIVKDNLTNDISRLDEDNVDTNSPPIKFYIEDYDVDNTDGLLQFITENFRTEFNVIRTNSVRTQGINWGQERVFLKAPTRIMYDKDCFYEPNKDSDVSCAYDYLINTYSKKSGFKKIAGNKAKIDFAINLPQQYQKDIYKNWLNLYHDDRHLEIFQTDEVHPLPDIVDIEDLDDDLFKVVNVDTEYKWSEEDIKQSLSILDIIKWCIVAGVRCNVIDYDNTYYCSYNPDLFKGIHHNKRTERYNISLKVDNHHAYFIQGTRNKQSLSQIDTKFQFNGDPQLKRPKKKGKEKPELLHEYHLHPIKDVVVDTPYFPQTKDEWNELLTEQNILKTKPPPTINQLEEWMGDDTTIHHYSINKTNLNKFIDLLYKIYGMKPDNCIGSMNTITYATYGNLRVYSSKRSPKEDWSPDDEDIFFQEYPDAKPNNGIAPSATQIAKAIYNKEYKDKDGFRSMYNNQTRGIFYDAEIKPISRTFTNNKDFNRPVYGWDLKKAYTSALENNNYKWNVYDSISQPKKFRGTINPNWFYLCKNLTNEYPCKEGKGLILYHGCYLQHLKGKVMPKYEIPPAKTLEPDHFKLFVEKCKEWDGKVCGYTFKNLINCFVGFIKMKDGIGNYKHYLTTSKTTANRELLRNKTPTRINTSGLSWSKESLMISWATKHSTFETGQPIRLQVLELINEQIYLLWKHYRVCLLNFKFCFNWLNDIKQRKILQKIRDKKSVPSKIKRDICMDDKSLSIKTDCLFINSPFKCSWSEETIKVGWDTKTIKVMNEKQSKSCNAFSNYVINSWNSSNAFQISLECIKEADEYYKYIETKGRHQNSFKYIPNQWEDIVEINDAWELKKEYDWKKDLLIEGARIEGKGGRGKSELINELKDTMKRNKILYKWLRLSMILRKDDNIYKRLEDWRDTHPCFFKVYAPTNKASNRVGGTTLHKGLGIPFIKNEELDDDDEEKVEEHEAIDFNYLESIIQSLQGQCYTSKERKSSPCYDRIIVDEISMINGEGWSYLNYIKQRIPRIKFILAGNIENQLPPVQEEYRNFENAFVIKELADRNLLKLNYNFRIGRSSDELWDVWSDNPKRFKIQPEAPLTIRNLSFTNKTRKKVIQLLQDTLVNPRVIECKNLKDRIDPVGQTHYLKYVVGTPLIARKNNKDLKISKNEMWYVDCYEPLTLVEPVLDKKIEIDEKDLLRLFVSGYCITIHKSQGETYKDEYTIWDWERVSDPSLFIGRRLRYVAQSRSNNPENNITYR